MTPTAAGWRSSAASAQWKFIDTTQNIMETETTKDIHSILEEAAKSVLKSNLQEHRNKDGKVSKDKLLAALQHTVWDLLAVQCSEDYSRFSPAAVGAALILNGVSRDCVTFSKGIYNFRLKNTIFVLKRNIAGCISAGPYLCGHCYPSSITVNSPAQLAEIMMLIDSAFDDMKKVAAELMVLLEKKEVYKKKQEAIRNIASASLHAILDEYITPLGLGCTYKITVEGDKPQIHITLTQEKSIDIDAPLEKLAERLRDSKALLDSMKVIPGERKCYIDLDDLPY